MHTTWPTNSNVYKAVGIINIKATNIGGLIKLVSLYLQYVYTSLLPSPAWAEVQYLVCVCVCVCVCVRMPVCLFVTTKLL